MSNLEKNPKKKVLNVSEYKKTVLEKNSIDKIDTLRNLYNALVKKFGKNNLLEFWNLGLFMVEHTEILKYAEDLNINTADEFEYIYEVAVKNKESATKSKGFSQKKSSQESRLAVSNLSLNIKNQIFDLMKTKEELNYMDLINFLKKNKVVRKYHDAFLVNKKSAKDRVPEFEKMRKALLLVREVQKVFCNVIEIKETNKSFNTRKRENPHHIPTYKVVPV